MVKDITTTYTAWSFHLTEKEKQVFSQTGNEIPIKSYEVMLPRLNIGIARTLLEPGKKIQVLAELGVDVTTDGKRNTLASTNIFSFDPHLGIEGNYKNTVFLRFGVGNFQRVLDDRDTMNKAKFTVYQPAVGLGLNLNSFSLDYAFTSLQTQANPLYTHVISVRLNIKSAEAKKSKINTIENPSSK